MRCPICAGTEEYLCPMCRKPIVRHSHEGDYLCETHSFVNPIRRSDGATVRGDGFGGGAVTSRREKLMRLLGVRCA